MLVLVLVGSACRFLKHKTTNPLHYGVAFGAFPDIPGNHRAYLCAWEGSLPPWHSAIGSRGGSPAQSRTPHVPPPTMGGVPDFKICQTPFLKKVLREPGSNRAEIHQTLKLSETFGIDSGGPE